jgi:hypothetical protein
VSMRVGKCRDSDGETLVSEKHAHTPRLCYAPPFSSPAVKWSSFHFHKDLESSASNIYLKTVTSVTQRSMSISSPLLLWNVTGAQFDLSAADKMCASFLSGAICAQQVRGTILGNEIASTSLGHKAVWLRQHGACH